MLKNTNDSNFLGAMSKEHAENKYVTFPGQDRGGASSFTVKHYAGDVNYSIKVTELSACGCCFILLMMGYCCFCCFCGVCVVFLLCCCCMFIVVASAPLTDLSSGFTR